LPGVPRVWKRSASSSVKFFSVSLMTVSDLSLIYGFYGVGAVKTRRGGKEKQNKFNSFLLISAFIGVLARVSCRQLC
jgi:hypothetical protein